MRFQMIYGKKSPNAMRPAKYGHRVDKTFRCFVRTMAMNKLTANQIIKLVPKNTVAAKGIGK